MSKRIIIPLNPLLEEKERLLQEQSDISEKLGHINFILDNFPVKDDDEVIKERAEEIVQEEINLMDQGIQPGLNHLIMHHEVNERKNITFGEVVEQVTEESIKNINKKLLGTGRPVKSKSPKTKGLDTRYPSDFKPTRVVLPSVSEETETSQKHRKNISLKKKQKPHERKFIPKELLPVNCEQLPDRDTLNKQFQDVKKKEKLADGWFKERAKEFFGTDNFDDLSDYQLCRLIKTAQNVFKYTFEI